MDAMATGARVPPYSPQDTRLINELLIERRVRIEAEDRNQQFSVLLQRAGQKEAYYLNKNEKLRQKAKDLKAYGRDTHSKCKELCQALQHLEEDNKRLKLTLRDRATILPPDQAEIQRLTKEIELLRSAHNRIAMEMQQKNSKIDWRISELNKQNEGLINERKVLKQKLISLTDQQQTVLQENKTLKNEITRLKQQVQFQRAKSSSADAASEASDTETCSLQFSHSSIPNFLQMFEEQSRERQKIRDEMQANLDHWTTNNPFSPTKLLGEDNRDLNDDAHSSLDGAGSSIIEFRGSQDTLDDVLDTVTDDSLSQVDSVLNRHRLSVEAGTETVKPAQSGSGITTVKGGSEDEGETKQENVERKREEADGTADLKEKDAANSDTTSSLLSGSYGGVSLEELRPGMNLEERLDYVDRLLEKEERKAAEDEKEGLLDFRLLRSVNNENLMHSVQKNLARIRQSKHGAANDHTSVIEFAKNGYYNRCATPENEALDSFEYLKTIPTDTEGSVTSSPIPAAASSTAVSSASPQPQRTAIAKEPEIVRHCHTASDPHTPQMFRRSSVTNTNQLRSSTRSTASSRTDSSSSYSRQHRRTYSADSTLDNTIKIINYSQKPWAPYRANHRKLAPSTPKRTPDFKALKYQQRNGRHTQHHSSTEDMYRSQSDISVASGVSMGSNDGHYDGHYSVLRKPYRRSFSDDHSNQINGTKSGRVRSVSNECLKVAATDKATSTTSSQSAKPPGKKGTGLSALWGGKKDTKHQQPLSSSASYQKVATDTRLGKNNSDTSGKQHEKHKLSFWRSSPLSKKRQSIAFTQEQASAINGTGDTMFGAGTNSNNAHQSFGRPRSASFTSMQILEVLPPMPATSVSNFSFIGQSNSQLENSPREKMTCSNDALYETKRVNNMLITNL